jgi:hypothetical protein
MIFGIKNWSPSGGSDHGLFYGIIKEFAEGLRIITRTSEKLHGHRS